MMRIYKVILLILLNIPLFSQTLTDSLLVFYSPDCRHCKYLLNIFLPSIEKDYRVSVKTFNVEIAKYMYYLEKLEENVKEVGDELPVVFFKNSVIYGSEKVFKNLRDILNQYQAGAIFHVTYLTKSGCRECSRVDKIMKVLTKGHVNVAVHIYDINIKENKLLAEAISESLGVPEDRRLIAPTIFLGNDYFVKGEIRLSKLEEVMKRYPFGTKDFAALNPHIKAQSEEAIEKRFATIGVLGVIGAGLLDGINPCAFATIVFFIGYLLFVGRRRLDILVMAICFAFGVFITYFSVGMGFFQILNLVANFKLVSRIIFTAFGVLAIVLGLLSLWDFFKALRGKLNEMKLQLPYAIKVKIHESIKEKTSNLGIGIGALVVGVIVSLFEFGCTGQVYLPTITYVISNPQLKARAVALLVVYNIMFIVPLLMIAGLGLAISTQRVGQFLKNRIALIKLLTTLLFFTLGILLIFFS